MTSYVLVSNDLHRCGGMDRANYELADYLARQRRSTVHLVSFMVAPPLSEQDGIVWHRVAKPLDSYSVSEPLLDWKGRSIARRLAHEGSRVVVNGGNCCWPDVNWVHYVHAGHAPRVVGSPLRSVRAHVVHYRALRNERAALQRARVVICNSQLTRGHVIERCGVAESRAHVVYYGCDAAQFSPATPARRAAARAELGWRHERPVLLFVGALGDRRKGFDVLFAAWQELCRDSDWDCDLAVVGKGGELPAWRRRAQQSAVASRIHFLGFRRDVPTVLAACDAMVHPARYEAFGLGVQEALCCNLPAFVTRTAGVAEYYPKNLDDLLLDDPPSPSDLVQRLGQWRKRVDAYCPPVAEFGSRLRARTWAQMSAEIAATIEQNA
jgi:glycosyltransferase involved in cell wall biosynthesis